MSSVRTYISAFLKQCGVKKVFGIPGGYNVNLISELDQTEGIDFVCNAHEEGGALAAQGYAKVTGKFGVVTTTAGPGSTNAFTGLISSRADNDSVLFLNGGVTEANLNIGAVQDALSFDVDILRSLKETSIYQKDILNVEDFDQYFPTGASHLLWDVIKSGPVHFQIAADVWTQETTLSSNELPSRSDGGLDNIDYLFEPNSDGDVDMVMDLVKGSARPIILSGYGVYQAEAKDEVARLASELNIPLFTTLKGCATVDHNHPNFVGCHGMFSHNRAEKWIKEKDVDLVIALGTSFNEISSDVFSGRFNDVKIVHVDVNEDIVGRYYKHSIPVIKDLKSFLGDLNGSIATSNDDFSHVDQMGEIEEIRKLVPDQHKRRAELIDNPSMEYLSSQRIYYEISEALQDYPVVNVVGDTGNSLLYTSHYFHFREGYRCFLSSGFGSMGFAVPVGMGVSLGSIDMGEVDTPTICLLGDGSFIMNGNELASISNNNIPIIIIVLNDGRLNMVSQLYGILNNELLKSLKFNKFDISKIGEALGVTSIVIDQPGVIDKKFISDLVDLKKPVLVDCRIDPTIMGPGEGRLNQLLRQMGRVEMTGEEMEVLLRSLE